MKKKIIMKSLSEFLLSQTKKTNLFLSKSLYSGIACIIKQRKLRPILAKLFNFFQRNYMENRKLKKERKKGGNIVVQRDKEKIFCGDKKQCEKRDKIDTDYQTYGLGESKSSQKISTLVYLKMATYSLIRFVCFNRYSSIEYENLLSFYL